MEKYIMTREGYNNLQKELNNLRTKEMAECLLNLSEAKDKGDISENAEYEVAKQALEEINTRMNALSNRLANSQIIEGVVDDGTVQILTTVKYININTNKEFQFKIVPEFESDIKAGKISQNSSIGKSLLNHRVGDIVEVVLPKEKNLLKILEIKI